MSEQNLAIIALIASIIALISGVVGVIAGLKVKKWRSIFGAENQPDNLEEVLTSITQKLQQMNSHQTSLEQLVRQNGATLETAFQYSSVIRFNSGSNDGGNLSFALALLDGKQTGLIITSLHGREHNRIYCKAITNGQPQQQLNEEEQQALIEAVTGTMVSNPKTKKSTKQK